MTALSVWGSTDFVVFWDLRATEGCFGVVRFFSGPFDASPLFGSMSPVGNAGSDVDFFLELLSERVLLLPLLLLDDVVRPSNLTLPGFETVRNLAGFTFGCDGGELASIVGPIMGISPVVRVVVLVDKLLSEGLASNFNGRGCLSA